MPVATGVGQFHNNSCLRRKQSLADLKRLIIGCTCEVAFADYVWYRAGRQKPAGIYAFAMYVNRHVRINCTVNKGIIGSDMLCGARHGISPSFR